MKIRQIVKENNKVLYITIPAKEAKEEGIIKGDAVDAEITKLIGGEQKE